MEEVIAGWGVPQPGTDTPGKAEGANRPLLGKGQHQDVWGYSHPKLVLCPLFQPPSPGVQGHSLPLRQRTGKFTSLHSFKLFTDTFFHFCSEELTETTYK